MIRFSCPGCGAVYSVTDEKAGKTGKCPKCQTPFTIPAAEAPAPVAPPPPPPKPSSNPFAELAADDAPRKKKPSKADLDDDFDDRPKKKPARAVDDEDDRPKKKPRRDDDEDDYDDAPKKKKAPSKAELDDEDDRPKKKSRRDEDDDYDDAPKKKKPARAAADDDFDDEDDRPRKKKGRRDDDDYDDRPRKKKGKSGLLLTASILHIVAAAIYLPCSGLALAGAGLLGGMVGAADTVSRDSRNQARVTGNRAGADMADKAISDVSTALTLLQVTFIASVLGACVAIPAAIAGFTRKKWFVPVSLASGGLLVLSSLIFLATSVGFLPAFPVLGVLMFTIIPLAFGVIAVLAAVNKNVKRVLS